MPEDKPMDKPMDKPVDEAKKVKRIRLIKQGEATKYFKKASLLGAIRRINKTEDFINKRLATYYKTAKKEMLDEIEQFYEKYAKSAEIALLDAKKRINTVDFNGINFKQLAIEAAESGDKELLDLVDRLSKKGQITRLELLNLEIERKISSFYEKEQKAVYEHIADTYADSYYFGAYNIDKAFNIQTAFTVINEDVITAAVKNKWSKRHFSKTIWWHREKLSEDLRSVITKHLIKGSSVEKMSLDLSKRCDVSYRNAKRLVRTESNHIHNRATLDAYTNEANIENYVFLATLDFKTSRICRDYDGKPFPVNLAKAGVNYPPMHPNCRSTVMPEMEGDYKGMRLARDANGKNYYVKGDITYHEWYESIPKEKRKRMELEQKKAVNLKADEKQYKNYKAALKNSINVKDETGEVVSEKLVLPRSLKGFQSLKYESGDWDRYKAEFKSISSDAKQLENFTEILGNEGLPNNIASFRELKYNKSNEYDLLRRSYENDKLFMKANNNRPKDSMDKERFQRMTTGLKRVGIDVISDKDTDEYLTAMGAEAMTMSDGKAILIRSGSTPTASAFFEEIIHATQIRINGGLNEYSVGVNKEYLRREIEANKKLLKYAKAYGFTENDVLDIRNNLGKYEQEWQKGGFDNE